MAIVLQRTVEGCTFECRIDSWQGVEATPAEMIEMFRKSPDLAGQLMDAAIERGYAYRVPTDGRQITEVGLDHISA